LLYEVEVDYLAEMEVPAHLRPLHESFRTTRNRQAQIETVEDTEHTDLLPGVESRREADSGNLREVGDVLFEFDLNAILGDYGSVGCEFDGTYFYISQYDDNLIYKLDREGNLVDTINLIGIYGIRDLAWDGEYLYGSENDNIHVINVETNELINTIPSPTGTYITGLTYDDRLDGFWYSNYNTPLYFANRDWEVVQEITNPVANLYGIACDNYSPGGPYLWLFSQDGGGILHQLEIATGELTGFTYDMTYGSGIAGGAFVTTDYIDNTATLGGITQAYPDVLFGIDLGYSGVPWVVIDPPAASVWPEDNGLTGMIYFDADPEDDGENVMLAGSYFAIAHILSNDPVTPDVEVLCTFNITGGTATLTSDTDELYDYIVAQDPLQHRVTLCSDELSNVLVDWEIASEIPDWLTLSMMSGHDLEPGECHKVDFTYDTNQAVGLYETTVVIEWSGGESAGTILIPVTMDIFNPDIDVVENTYEMTLDLENPPVGYEFLDDIFIHNTGVGPLVYEVEYTFDATPEMLARYGDLKPLYQAFPRTRNPHYTPSEILTPPDPDAKNALGIDYRVEDSGHIRSTGEVLNSWVPEDVPNSWGLATTDEAIWLNHYSIFDPDPIISSHRYEDGRRLAPELSMESFMELWCADMAYDANHNILWVVQVSGLEGNAIYGIDYDSGEVVETLTGEWTFSSARGLAYDNNTDTFYIGSWNYTVIYVVEGIDSETPGATINTIPFQGVAGLAFHEGANKLAVTNNGELEYIYLVDPETGEIESQYDPPANDGIGRGAGIEFDEYGHLWMVRQNVNGVNMVYQVDFGTLLGRRDRLPWLVIDPPAAAVWPEDSPLEGTVIFDAQPNGEETPILIADDYFVNVHFKNNDPEMPDEQVLCVFHITGGCAEVSTAPEEFYEYALENEPLQKTLNFCNAATSNAVVNWQVTSELPDWLSLDMMSGTQLRPNDCDEITLTFNTDQRVGIYETVLSIDWVGSECSGTVDIPVGMNIYNPNIDVVEDAYYMTIDLDNPPAGYEVTDDIYVYNNGTGPMLYEVSYNYGAPEGRSLPPNAKPLSQAMVRKTTPEKTGSSLRTGEILTSWEAEGLQAQLACWTPDGVWVFGQLLNGYPQLSLHEEASGAFIRSVPLLEWGYYPWAGYSDMAYDHNHNILWLLGQENFNASYLMGMDIETGELLYQLDGPWIAMFQRCSGLSYNHNTDQFYIGSFQNQILVIDGIDNGQPGTLISSFPSALNYPATLAFHEASNRLLQTTEVADNWALYDPSGEQETIFVDPVSPELFTGGCEFDFAGELWVGQYHWNPQTNLVNQARFSDLLGARGVGSFPFLSVIPEVASVWPEDSPVMGTIKFDADPEDDGAEILFSGLYYATATFESNDPEIPEFPVYCEFNLVGGAPDPYAMPDSFRVSLQPGETNDENTLIIGNGANANTTLDYEIVLEPAVSWLTLDHYTNEEPLGFDATDEITLYFDATGVPEGDNEVNLLINWTDNQEGDYETSGTITVPVVLDVYVPRIEPSPVGCDETLTIDFEVGQTDVPYPDNFTLTNSGEGDLVYTIDLQLRPELSLPGGLPQTIEGVDVTPNAEHQGVIDVRAERRQDARNLRNTGSPDWYGYTWIDSDEAGGPEFIWNDISESGVELLMGADETQGPFDLGFDFEFYGQTFNSVYICSKGYLSFTSNMVDYTNSCIGDIDGPENMFAAFWADLGVPWGGTVYYQAGPDEFIVEFDAVMGYYGIGGPYTFQFVIHRDGRMALYYDTMVGDTVPIVAGIEDNAQRGLEIVCNEPYIHNQLAVMINPPVSWVSAEPYEGVIAGGESIPTTLTFNPEPGLLAGMYYANMIIESNDPETPQCIIPIEMNITGGTAEVSVVPEELNETVLAYTPYTQTLNVCNAETSTSAIAWTVSTDVDWLLFSPAWDSGIVPGECREMDVIFNTAQEVGTLEGTIFIHWEAGDNSGTLNVPVAMNVYNPEIGVDTEELRLSIDRNTGLTTDPVDVVIQNTGSGDLTYQIVVDYNAEVPQVAAARSVRPLKEAFSRPRYSLDNSDPITTTLPVEGSLPQSRTSTPVLRDQGDVLLNVNVQAETQSPYQSAVYFDGTYFYTGDFNRPHIYKLDRNGNILDHMVISGINAAVGFLDFTSDGEYLYATYYSDGARGNTLYQIDLDAQAVVGTIEIPELVSLDGLTYDEDRDGFWVGSYEGIQFIHRDGTVEYYDHPSYRITGLAYDNLTLGGPYLWIFDPYSGGDPVISQYDIFNQELTGVTLSPGISGPYTGGLFLTTQWEIGTILLCAMVQSDPDQLVGIDLGDFAYEYATFNPGMGTVMAGESVTESVFFDAQPASAGGATMIDGEYYAVAHILSNDPEHPDVEVGCYFTITGGECLPLMDTDAISLNLYENQTESVEIVITNDATATAALDYTFTEDPEAAWLDTSPSMGNGLMPRYSETVTVWITAPSEAGTYTTTLTANFGCANTINIPVSITVTDPQITVEPVEISAQVNDLGEMAEVTLTIDNLGSGDLPLMAEIRADMETASTRYLKKTVVGVDEGGVHGETDRNQNTPVLRSSGGPDYYGYTWTDSNEDGGPFFVWNDIREVGTELFSRDSDNFPDIELGFDFNFYGQTFSTVNIASTGFITFTSDSQDFSNSCIGMSDGPENMIAGFWDDLRARGGKLYYYTDGNTFTVQYTHWKRFSSSQEGDYTFQIVLHDNDDIHLYYQSMSGILNSATIGIEDNAGAGLEIACNAEYVQDDLAVKISPSRWLYTTPEQLTLNSDGSAEVTVYLDASRVDALGTYTGSLAIIHNDADIDNPIVIPVSFNVGGNLFDVTGQVQYWNDTAISNTEVMLAGDREFTAQTSETGMFAFMDTPEGNYTLSVNLAGYGDATQPHPSISAFDAARVAQYSAGLYDFNEYQMMAADVTGDGGISPFDAARILQYSSHISSSARTGEWLWLPEMYEYMPLDADQPDQDFTGIIYGEVTGNWSPEAAARAHKADHPVAMNPLSVTDLTVAPDHELIVPVYVTDVTGLGVIAMQAVLDYDSEMLEFVEYRTAGTLTEGFVLAEGTKHLAGYRLTPLEGEGTLINIVFQVLGDVGQTGTVMLDNLMFNEQPLPAIQAEVKIVPQVMIPEQVILSQNYPNPFNPKTRIDFGLPVACHISLRIYNLQGQLVNTLVDETMEAGYHTVEWNGTDQYQRDVASGVYLYVLETGEGVVRTHRMTLLK